MSISSITKAFFDPNDQAMLSSKSPNQKVFSVLSQKSTSRIGRFQKQSQIVMLHQLDHEIEQKEKFVNQ